MTVLDRVAIMLTRDELLEIRTYSDAITDYRLGRGDHSDYVPIAGHGDYERRFRGCLGEYALAKHLGVEYQFTLGFEADGDVHGYEVRTRGRHHYELPTNANDRPAVYVLATTETDRIIVLHGWAYLHETLIPERWAAHMARPCYLTPQSQLHPLEQLPK
jgi:hypothetical protein